MNVNINTGDRVRVVNPGMSFGDYTVGDIAVVKRSYGDYDNLFKVHWETNLLHVKEGPRCDLLHASEVEVIEKVRAGNAALDAIDRQLEFTGASDYPGASAEHRNLLMARAAIVALADAAKPFAGLLQDHNDVKPNGQPYPDNQIVFAINTCEITVGQLRQLKAALATCTEGAHESLSDRPG